MYQPYYQLSTAPFENTPEPRFFFASEHHREALAAIEYTIRLRKGFVLITGDIGSGKTTVGQTMCDRCAERMEIVPLMHGQHDAVQLLQQVHRALGLAVNGDEDHNVLLETLREHVHRQHSQHQSVVLLVDEAQTYSDVALEELRLLSNFEHRGLKLFQIVLIGQPELRDRLSTPRMAALRQRIVLAKRVAPLSLPETGAYIRHRLRVASMDTQRTAVAFTGPAVERIYRHSGGIPRLINTLCDNCLLVGFVQDKPSIDPAIVHKVIHEMMPDFDQAPAAGVSQRASAQERLSLVGSM